MRTEGMTAQEIIKEYRDDIKKLMAYLPWLSEKKKMMVSSFYNHEELAEHSLVFPVYDSRLMQFVRDARDTKFMNPNYVYLYTRNRLKGTEAEKKMIAETSILKLDQLGDILSRYILGGQTKAMLWTQGMQEGIFFAIVSKAAELLEFWENAEKQE